MVSIINRRTLVKLTLMKRDNCNGRNIRGQKKAENNFYDGARLPLFGNVSSRDEVGTIIKLMSKEKYRNHWVNIHAEV